MGHRDGAAAPTAWTRLALVLTVSLQPLVVGCTAILPEQAGSLSSYDRLEPSDGLLTRAQVSVNKDEILSARTVRINPTTFSAATASAAGLSEPQARLIANAVDRSLCTGLSRRFQIASAAQPADLTVRAFITRIIPTDEIAAAASSVTSVGMTVVKATGVVTAAIPSLRIPIGLGGLALEAEALDRTGSQKAAIIWARGANPSVARGHPGPATLTSSRRPSVTISASSWSPAPARSRHCRRCRPWMGSMQRWVGPQGIGLRGLRPRRRRARPDGRRARLAAGIDRQGCPGEWRRRRSEQVNDTVFPLHSIAPPPARGSVFCAGPRK